VQVGLEGVVELVTVSWCWVAVWVRVRHGQEAVVGYIRVGTDECEAGRQQTTAQSQLGPTIAPECGKRKAVTKAGLCHAAACFSPTSRFPAQLLFIRRACERSTLEAPQLRHVCALAEPWMPWANVAR
jgi:hypothetical protein